MHLLVWTMTRKYCESLKHHLAVQQCTFHPYSPLCLTSALIQSGLEKRNETSSAVWSHQKSFGIRRAPARKAREGRGETLQYGMFSTCPACSHRQSVQRYSFRISTVCFECEVMKQTTMLQNTGFGFVIYLDIILRNTTCLIYAVTGRNKMFSTVIFNSTESGWMGEVIHKL